MNTEKWIREHTERLDGKTVALSGATGGLGREICRYLLSLGARLWMLDRNMEKSYALHDELLHEFPNAEIENLRVDMADILSVRDAVGILEEEDPPDILIHNAGAYSIPRYVTEAGYDNVFTIDFASPYYLTRELLPAMRTRPGSRVVAVGSIAHRYSKTDAQDVDFRTRKAASLVYGNAKRRLMFSLYELFRDEKDVTLSVVHPGISFTDITAHYPPWLFKIIKYPMKVIFPKPRTAALSVIDGVFRASGYCEWTGPWLFDVWGHPTHRVLRSVKEDERRAIAAEAEEVHARLSAFSDINA